MPEGIDNNMMNKEINNGNVGQPQEAPKQTPLQRYIQGMEKGEFGPIGGGEPWLYRDQAELDGIKSTKLKRVVESLERTPASVLTQDVLRQRYIGIEDGIIAGEIDPTEAQDFQIKIQARIEALNPPARSSTEKSSSFLGKPKFVERSFKTGKFAPNFKDFQGNETTPLLDVTKEEDRNLWMYENLRGFNDGTVSEPAKYWKAAIDIWIEDLNEASCASTELRSEVQSTTEKLKAAMSVFAASWAMRASTGSAGSCAGKLVPSEVKPGEPNLDLVDTWGDYLLAGHPEKYALVLSDPLVKSYYERICGDAGLIDLKEIGDKEPDPLDPKKTKVRKNADFKVDATTTFRKENDGKRLIDYLTKGENRYFDGYIADVLLKNDTNSSSCTDNVRWSAAKLACDLFLVDKYTLWQFKLEQECKGDKEKMKLFEGLKPYGEWGGDPLRSILEPSFLVDKIKKMYQGEFHFMLDKLDKAFRPTDIFENQTYEDALIKPSMVEGLKRYARYNDALWTFLGSSRGANIPNWGDKSILDFFAINELLDQVYGEIKGKGAEPINVGKHIVGLMLARMIELKTEAVAFQTSDPTFKQLFAIAMGNFSETNPMDKMQKAFWGENEDGTSGFVFEANGPRTRTVLSGRNVFGAKDYLDKAWTMLNYNAATAEGIKAARRANRIGYVLDFIRIFGSQPVTSSRGKRK